MANTRFAAKRARQALVRNKRNQARRSRIRTAIKNVELAVSKGNSDEARAAFNVAQPLLHQAVTRNLLKRNTVARQVSKLSGLVKKISQTASA